MQSNVKGMPWILRSGIIQLGEQGNLKGRTDVKYWLSGWIQKLAYKCHKHSVLRSFWGLWMMRVWPLTHNPILRESFTYRWFIKHSGVFPEEGCCVLPRTTITKPLSWHWTVLKLEACHSTPKYEWFWFSFYFDFISQLEVPLLPVTTFQRILGQEHSRPAFGGAGDTKPSKCWRHPVTLPSPLHLQKPQPPRCPSNVDFSGCFKIFYYR